MFKKKLCQKVVFFWSGRGLNPEPCIFYALSRSTEHLKLSNFSQKIKNFPILLGPFINLNDIIF